MSHGGNLAPDLRLTRLRERIVGQRRQWGVVLRRAARRRRGR
jgi:hypothetical protein